MFYSLHGMVKLTMFAIEILITEFVFDQTSGHPYAF